MTTSKELWTTKNPRARAEWDFRAQWKGCDKTKYPFEFLAPEEVYYCWRYEYDRMLPRDVDGVLAWRKNAPARDFESLLEHHKLTRPDPIVVDYFYPTWPQWPEQPYLSVPSSKRREQFDRQWPKEARKPRCLRVVPLADVANMRAWDLPNPQLPNFTFRNALLRRSKEAVRQYDGAMATFVRHDAETNRDYVRAIAAFEVDFSLSPTVLCRLFENWCRKMQKERGWKQKPNKAGASPIEKLRAELNCLGAFRLHQSGLSYSAATEFTRKASGVPLYSDKSDWSKAVTTGRELIYAYA